MDIRSMLLTVFWLALAPLADPGGAPAWEPARDGSPQLALDRVHPPGERPHERWLPELALDWEHSRRLAVSMVCDLGVIALALVECPDLMAVLAGTPAGSPKLPAVVPPAPGGMPAPDFQDIRRRSIEERMHSI